MITLNWLQGPEQLAARLNSTRMRAMNALADQLYISMGKLREYIVNSKLSGQVLRHRTGHLKSSIFPSIEQSISRYQLTGKVSVDNTAFYGEIHEFGGTFVGNRKHLKHPAHLIRRKAGEWVMTGSPYGMHFPERSFMRSSLREKREEIIGALATALNRAVNR